jgi:hydroxyacylglutathione hydrolase
MLLKYFYDKKLAQTSYMVGCAATGEALVIDPARDINSYLEAAHDEGLQITHVTETHIHADFVSGSRELAVTTGAKLFLSDMGDANWKYQFADRRTTLIQDGDFWMVGNVRVDVMATPGHTPEHVIFQITDTAATDAPIGLFTGDFLFVGSIGRPDLLDKAAGFKDTMEIGARQQFENIQRLRDMPDYLQIWPGHGAGSACGKSLGAIPSSTLGYERMINPAFQFDDQDDFVEWLLEGQPEPPFYFAHMKKVNKEGPALLNKVTVPKQLDENTLDKLISDGALVIDARDGTDFAAAFIGGTVNIPHTSNNFSTYVGWLVNFEKPLYLIAPEGHVGRLIQELRAIGVDHIGGYFTEDVIGHFETQILAAIDVDSLARQRDSIEIIDVRNLSEHEESRIPDAKHIALGYVLENLKLIRHDTPIAVHCESGVRSQIVSSLLIAKGYTNIFNVTGGIKAWKNADLPVEKAILSPQTA